MRRLHLAVGFAFVAVFLATGAHMRAHFPAAHGGDVGVRMMYRSAHVYIVLAALLNLALAAQWRWRPARWRRLLQAAGSAAVSAAPFVFTTAFFLEPAPQRFDRPYCLVGLALAAIGTLLHTAASFGDGPG
jgi:hypothetical protein